ncbi:nucleoside triphosphate pyrophosphohydrolase family protein [Candidatus Saccharibacteria bacterium]|nr:nucleoside triphosphate pyrophosphohydrolase family protein [Candidatus Saccharibacteria bacterium]
MDLDKYQKNIIKYDTFGQSKDLNSPEFIEKVLGLAGEAGEVTDKVKKIIRDKGGRANSEDITAISKELGDVLWYVASIARCLDLPLSKIASQNIDKLEDRYKRNKIHGAGDER